MAITRATSQNGNNKHPTLNGGITKIRGWKAHDKTEQSLYSQNFDVYEDEGLVFSYPPPRRYSSELSAPPIILLEDNSLRPEPFGVPPAWAAHRPELCDSLPWFRSTQGGCYHLDGIAFGMLIDGDSGKRAYLDHEVVITRVGGGCSKENGGLVLKRDIDDRNHAFTALRFNWEHDIPVGVIIGDRNTVCETKMPYRYNVTDFFRITDIWFERIDGRLGAQVRLEKLSLTSKSWWAPKDIEEPLPINLRTDAVPPELPACDFCNAHSRKVYDEGWMCLQPSCPKFWTLKGGEPPKELTFAPAFLRMRSQSLRSIVPQHSLVPNLLETFPRDGKYSRTARVMWKGIVCPKCQRCVARTLWNGWVCPLEDKGCGFSYFDTPDPVELRTILSEFEMGAVGHRYPANNKLAIRPKIQYLKNYRVDTYDLGMGNILSHFAANNTVNCADGGPNFLFRELCMQDIGLKRHKLKASVVKNTLTSHFAVNFGMPYKYIVAVDSKSFQDTPPFLLQALGRLTWAVRKTVPPAEFQRPNELLTLGYFEKMAINYHDDGEDTLGPTIATLSLGVEATMLVRLKQKYFKVPEQTSKNFEMEDLVLPSCSMEAERRELKIRYESQQISRNEYWKRLAHLRGRNRRREASPFCSLELHHGDMVVMHGANLQKYYEHSVTPNGQLRFALTARYVMPERVEPEHHWKGDYEPNPDYEYDGDE
ncbi:hypothetical protein LOZ12_002134 [Ophidiomyces ophidiicola]|uniref:Uncharacterized protein n=1 Tax=Ophidiomyces ophidiicola TaxID=1387563 RepID=A0ACB8UYK8_9EURO|nr:hypothetical protein LOZ64_001422 [Ophidiomyces ophidiicola]KAI1949375.1 hypothetical protein LOZ62_002339 [Ophidiomyces ophidiicola]KAI1971367.1 hypothetical protein LOZ56_003067 [Ophidiomyces ophidiicola]KAI2005954.1 hypothetical protein LOZ50_003345 [Ophidiomyces ophidiicola]KAI2030694.1 hypothetical protein LOZ45_001476 [Ophidiomyces ophidiicola]